jgi:hypothetical protein
VIRITSESEQQSKQFCKARTLAFKKKVHWLNKNMKINIFCSVVLFNIQNVKVV